MGGRTRAYSRGFWGKHRGISASDISARASTPLDERRRYLAIQKSEAEATPQKLFWKRGRGLCEGGLRRHKQRSYKTQAKDKYNKALNTLVNRCEEETEA